MGLLNHVSRKAESPLLKEGDHIVHAISYMDCTSKQDVEIRDGKLAVIGDKLAETKWNTPTGQIAILVGNETGVCCDRLSEMAWKKPADLTAVEQASNEFTVSGEYAVHMVDGKLERIPKVDLPPTTDKPYWRNSSCERRIESFLYALAGGVELVNLVDEAIANKTPFIVNIKKVTWTNPATNAVSVQYRINSFKAIKDGVVPTMKVAGLVIPEDLAS